MTHTLSWLTDMALLTEGGLGSSEIYKLALLTEGGLGSGEIYKHGPPDGGRLVLR